MGAIGDPYVTLDQFKTHLGIPPDDIDAPRDELLTTALNSASTEINNHCGRQFNRQEDATARKFSPIGNGGLVLVDDFYTEDDLVIQSVIVGDTVGDPWDSALYELEPENGLVNGIPSAFCRIKLSTRGSLGLCSRDRIRVTAKWGWPDVPADVQEACLLLAATNHKLRDAPLGTAGFSKFGTATVSSNPIATAKLCPYVLGRTKA